MFLVEYLSTLGLKVGKLILAIHSLIDRSLSLTIGSKVLGLILTTQSLINRSLGNSFLSLKLFHFLSKKILLAPSLSLSLSLSSLALSQKSYGLDPSCSLQVFIAF
jgi:hypothetical protein